MGGVNEDLKHSSLTKGGIKWVGFLFSEKSGAKVLAIEQNNTIWVEEKEKKLKDAMNPIERKNR